MTPDDERLMAYADGELGPIEAKRVAAAIAADPALAAVVDAQRRLRERLAAGFAPVAAEPVPDRFAAMLNRTVVPLPAGRSAVRRFAAQAAAIAATLVLGVTIGRGWTEGAVTTARGGLIASGELSRALDRQLSGAAGATRLLASFKDGRGRYCRVFAAQDLDGVACRDQGDWRIERAAASAPGSATAYRQAGSANAAVMADAQELMAGDPLDPAAERAARARDWH